MEDCNYKIVFFGFKNSQGFKLCELYNFILIGYVNLFRGWEYDLR